MQINRIGSGARQLLIVTEEPSRLVRIEGTGVIVEEALLPAVLRWLEGETPASAAEALGTSRSSAARLITAAASLAVED